MSHIEEFLALHPVYMSLLHGIASLQDNYDEEIETYKYYLEQAYKLCRPCQMAVQSYIKHQNRQLRTQLFNHQLRRSREADKAFTMVRHLNRLLDTVARAIGCLKML